MRVSIGVVGYGYWGSKHVRVLSSLPDVDVHVIDADSDRRHFASQAFHGVTVHADLDDALDEVHGVVIATPAASHHALAKRALQQGVHSLVEKPLALNVADCEDLIRTAEDSCSKLMVGHTFEYNAGIWKIRELMDSGELGEILYVDTARLNLGLYQPDVNVIWDLGPHDISILNFLFRSVPESVTATAGAHRGGRLSDVATIQLSYADGVKAYCRLSWLDPVKVRRVSVIGSRKMVVNNDTAAERIRIYDAGVDATGPAERFHDLPLEYRYGGIVSPHLPFEEPLLVEDRHFVDCIRSDKDPATDGRAGMAVVQVLEAIQLSVHEGRSVSVQELLAVGRA